ncbi:DUF1156 domain-containing protein [Novosphingobium sp.]|uniref:DUF1156 domain-containing protein n=1 Tax=Novosphingobium sp. TaxID=1874826 RepID=UPI001E13327A|nr:DUF1156 domain-containing protein [Novosphingobium sp.]MBX9665922.1 DUF1156 domain-containing protein [Novosphingobium sp.]
MEATSSRPIRKKLIEVSIPLEAINKASAREKSIRHGHPSTLHLWWARRPLAACRAVLFAQLVDDPSAWPDRFPTEEAQDKERARLHRVIERLVPWEASNNETILNEARWEIARTVAWGLGEEPPPQQDTKAILDYLQTKAPPVYDPFSGGGSIPLEAQRLGLRAYGSDINPVAVLIGKALVEIPSKFAGLAPINPEARLELKRSGGTWTGKRAQGLAEDVRYYGEWMRDEAKKRIGHLYPTATLSDGSQGSVIGWIWSRTIRSPDPAAQGAMVPLYSSLVFSRMVRNKAWGEVVLDSLAEDGWRFTTHTGKIERADEERLRKGNVQRSGGAICTLTGASIPFTYIRSEGTAKRLGRRLMTVVVDGPKGREYLTPSKDHEEVGKAYLNADKPDVTLSGKSRVNLSLYGFNNFGDIFTDRQALALATFSELIDSVKTKVAEEAIEAGLALGENLADGGDGSIAYADAIATYLAFNISSVANSSSQICTWDPGGAGWNTKVRNTFSRQALPMTWDFVEINPFSGNSGSFDVNLGYLVKSISEIGISKGFSSVKLLDASKNNYGVSEPVFSTDPPYYDNIGYADLSDFFYIWLRKSLNGVWPNLFRRLSTPKDDELVATPMRHGGKQQAEDFFMKGMSSAITAIRKSASDEFPVAIYYAFKQAEVAEDGITSAGWASFLQAVVDSGLVVDGTWPVRTESAGRLIGNQANALASSIVLVCRKRSDQAAVVTRGEYIRLLKRELPQAIEDIRTAGVGPVDMQQSVIGPGMGIFSRHMKVLMDDDSSMTVRTALADINRIWGEIENEADASLDPETQVALAWFATYGFDARTSGELIMLANAKNVASDALYKSGVFQDLRGKAQLTPRTDLPKDWSPSTDKTLTIWECVQHAARVFRAEDGGEVATARLIGEMGNRSQEALLLAGRLFQIATDKGWSQEALVYNELAAEWPRLEALAGDLAASAPVKPVQANLDL